MNTDNFNNTALAVYTASAVLYTRVCAIYTKISQKFRVTLHIDIIHICIYNGVIHFFMFNEEGFMKITKILAIIMAVITALAMFQLSAGAEEKSLDEAAKTAKFGQTVENYLTNSENDNTYKFVLPSSTTLNVNFTSFAKITCVTVYDSNGNAVAFTDGKFSTGDFYIPNSNTVSWNEKVHKSAGTFTYTLLKGTYFVTFGNNNTSHSSSVFSFSLTTPKTATTSTAALKINLKAGEKISLGTIMIPTGKATAVPEWTSSSANVASIDASGNVTAKKKGQTTVTAKIGTSVLKFVVKVS